MALNYEYYYAEIQDEDGLCVGFLDSNNPNVAGPTGSGTTWIPVPVNDPEYCMKYYLNGNWYEDAEGTILWQSSLL